MSYFTSANLSLALPFAFAAGLTTLSGCTPAGLLPPTDQPGLTVIPAGPDLSASLAATIERNYHVSDIRVSVSDSFRADVDNDGVRNDTAGTALMRSGRRFKSFIFLTTAGGETRFLEANGGRFDPSTGGSVLSCSSKPIACPDTFERARTQIRPARFTLADVDPAQAGAELTIAYDDGSQGILNSLRLFSSE